MNIVQCSFCKKPFQAISGKVCPDCLKKMDADFIIVRDYIYENKRADMDKVSEETGVSKQVIIHLLKEGRLIMEEALSGLLTCETCKKPITTGRMCDDCKKSVAAKMDKIVSGVKAPAKKESTQNLRGTAKINK